MDKDKEKIQAALDIINVRISSIESDKEWLAYLLFQSKFYSYSALNSILIWCQNPNATYVRGFKAWNSMGRVVKMGEKGIKIFAPVIKTKELIKTNKANNIDLEVESITVKEKHLSGYRLTTVFDISQTRGDDSQLPVLLSGLPTINEAMELVLYKKLLDRISSRLPVTEAKMSTKGSYNITTNEIYISDNISTLHKIKTLIHEFAHCMDYNINPDPDFDRNKRELIAESVAFIVSQNIGIDTSSYSISYIRSWLKDDDELKKVADTIQKISYEIIRELALSDFRSDGAISA